MFVVVQKHAPLNEEVACLLKDNNVHSATDMTFAIFMNDPAEISRIIEHGLFLKDERIAVECSSKELYQLKMENQALYRNLSVLQQMLQSTQETCMKLKSMQASVVQREEILWQSQNKWNPQRPATLILPSSPTISTSSSTYSSPNTPHNQKSQRKAYSKVVKESFK